MDTHAFQKEIWNYYRAYGRDFPWRKTKNPYKILISEFMLQQTQTGRVEKKYKEFLSRFPNIITLADAPLGDVLLMWQGLGYNRRAKYLWETSKIISKKYKGKFPRFFDELLKLPGIGQSTAGAICVFSFQVPSVYIETNIRRVFIHFFFKKNKEVHDKDILPYIEKTLPKENLREWYYALMDYGAMLPKRSRVNANTQSKHYTKQTKFKGSDREIRGAILKMFQKYKTISQISLLNLFPKEKERMMKILNLLEKEGMLKRHGTRYKLP